MYIQPLEISSTQRERKEEGEGSKTISNTKQKRCDDVCAYLFVQCQRITL